MSFFFNFKFHGGGECLPWPPPLYERPCSRRSLPLAALLGAIISIASRFSSVLIWFLKYWLGNPQIFYCDHVLESNVVCFNAVTKWAQSQTSSLFLQNQVKVSAWSAEGSTSGSKLKSSAFNTTNSLKFFVELFSPPENKQANTQNVA